MTLQVRDAACKGYCSAFGLHVQPVAASQVQTRGRNTRPMTGIPGKQEVPASRFSGSLASGERQKIR